MPPAFERIRQLFGPRLEELTGAHVSADIPLTERVINQAIAAWLRSANTRVASAVAQVRDPSGVLVKVRLSTPAFAPAIVVHLRVAEQPDLPRSAVLVLQWSLPGLGLIEPLVAPVLASLKTGPPWIVVEGERIHVDIARALEERGLAALLAHLDGLRLAMRPGAVVVSVTLTVHG